MEKYNKYNLSSPKREPVIIVCSQKDNVERDYFESIEQQYLRFRKAGQSAMDYLRNLYGKEAMDEVRFNKDIDESMEELAEHTSFKADPMDVADYLRYLDDSAREAKVELEALYRDTYEDYHRVFSKKEVSDSGE